jgi:hypothetical protein
MSGLLAGLLPLVGNGLYDGGDGSGAAVLAQAEEGLPPIAWVAYPLELVGFGALCVLLGSLVALIWDHAPVAAVTTGIAGAAMVSVKLGTIAPGMALREHHEGVSAATAEVLVAIGDAGFVVSGLLLSVALTAAGVGLLRIDFPRWLAGWAVGAGGAGTLAGVVGVVAPAAYFPIPFLLLLVWMIAVGLRTALAANVGKPVGMAVAVPE